MFLMADVTVAFWYSQWRQSCRQPTDNIQFRLFSNIGPCIHQHYVLCNHWLCRHFAIPPMTTGAVILTAFWTKHTWTEIRPYNVGLRAFVIIGRVAVLRYRQWRWGLSSWLHYGQNIHGPKYVRTTSDWGLSWSLAALLSCDTANGDGGCHLDCIMDKTYMDRNTSVQRRIEGFRDDWPRCCLAIPPMATGLSSWLHYAKIESVQKYCHFYASGKWQ